MSGILARALELNPSNGDNEGLIPAYGIRLLPPSPAAPESPVAQPLGLMSPVIAKTKVQKKVRKITGLALWMGRVLEECDRAGQSLAADPVHDLRVALRRCRSIGAALMLIDPDPAWKQMRKAGKRIFAPLGQLRDVQIAQEWTHKLDDPGDPGDPVTTALLQVLADHESKYKEEAARLLHAFDRKQWARWCRALPRRGAGIRPGSRVFMHIALERWQEAYQLHRRAMRGRSAVALHDLRIGLKRFRYIVENFLPEQHKAWIGDLKRLQDLLGDVHDLDVLWTTARSLNVFPDAESRTRWRARIEQERVSRIAKYKELMTGPNALWFFWRAELPQGMQVKVAALERLKTWAAFHNADARHGCRVARLALQIYDGLEKGRGSALVLSEEREVLRIAALLHEAGRPNGRGKKARSKSKSRSRPKVAYKRINQLGPLVGAPDLGMAARIVRFQGEHLPQAGEKALQGLLAKKRSAILRLAGILRLAAAFDSTRDGAIERLALEDKKDFLLISAQGYNSRSEVAQAVAGARYLLETSYRRPIMVKAAAQRATRRALKA